MSAAHIWTKPDLRFPANFDTVLFDVDGVLIQTTHSFRAAIIAVVEYVVGVTNNIDWGQQEGQPLVTMADIEAFKRAGGFNDDVTMCYLFSSLMTACKREWLGTPLAERPMSEWAALAREAQLQGLGGRVWVDATVPQTALVDNRLVTELFLEFYWGATGLRTHFGREPQYVPDAPGLVHNEKLLLTPDLGARLRESGVAHLGVITGRIGPEVISALGRFEQHCGERWWDVVVSADEYAKPDPQALRYALKAVNAGGALYIGDTADDLDLVLNYRQQQDATEPDVLAVMVAHGDQIELYRQRGADIIISSVVDIQTYLANIL